MYNMHLIINTHWDREYRWSFGESQMRLEKAVDDLIDIMNKDEGFKYFHTDSQVSMLDDYIDIHPERAEELKKLVKDGRILTGPWYTLPAEFLVSGEALTRNLLLGHKISKEIGNVMKAGYNIFSWGQVSQLPQIYRQFGMDTIIFYRGIDQSKLNGLEFKWVAPDGNEALGITFGEYHRLNFWKFVYLPYIFGENGINRLDFKKDEFLFNICDENSVDINHTVLNQHCERNIEMAMAGLKKLKDTVTEKSSINELLFLQGFDLENPDPIIVELVEKINERLDEDHLFVSNLPEYMTKLKEELAKQGKLERLPVIEGEMLDVEKVDDAFGPLYNGVFSARMPIKLLNGKSQRILEKWAEPLAVFDMMLGERYPEVSINKAWKELLKNQQHDGIGGCHIDRVSYTMTERYNNVCDISNAIIKNSLMDIVAKIDLSSVEKKEIAVVVFNATQYRRRDVIKVLVDIPWEWSKRQGGINSRNYRNISVKAKNKNGDSIKCSVLSIEDDTVFGYLKFGNVIDFDSARCLVAIETDEIEPFGYGTFVLYPEREIERPIDRIASSDNVLENEYIYAKINSNGTLSITDKRTGRVFDDIHYFEDIGDKGGPLKFDPPYERGEYNTLGEKADISLVYNGNLSATYKISYKWKLPEELDAKLKVHVPHGSEWIDQGVVKRSNKKRDLLIDSYVTLCKDKKRIDFKTVVNNTICDHRLRVKFRTNMTTAEHSVADSPYDIVKRDIKVPCSTGWYEEASVTWPSQSFVSVSDEMHRVAVLHNSIPEYEVEDNCGRAICLTLLRAFGNAGNPTELYCYQKLAECPGEHTFEYSFLIDEEKSISSLVRSATEYTVPFKTVQTTAHNGELGMEQSFLSVSSEEFVITAIKKAENSNSVIVRGYAIVDSKITIRLLADVKSVKKVSLEENEIEDVMISDNSITVDVKKGEIASYLFEV